MMSINTFEVVTLLRNRLFNNVAIMAQTSAASSLDEGTQNRPSVYEDVDINIKKFYGEV